MRKIFNFFTYLLMIIFFPTKKRLHHDVRLALKMFPARYIWEKYKAYQQSVLLNKNDFKYYSSIVMCVKDEGRNILEWIEYYLLLGVDHFYIFNNNGTDNTKELLQNYIDKGLVTWQDYHGQGLQMEIYNYAVNRYKNETRWMAFIDCDEFIVLHRHKSISHFLKEYEAFNQIVIYWMMYGSSGHIKRPKGGVLKNFTKHAKSFHTNEKSIVNPRACFAARAHRHCVFGETVNEHKQLPALSKKAKPSGDIIQVNHYFVKSFEDYQNKRKRGDVINKNWSYKEIAQEVEYQNFLNYEGNNNEVDEPNLMLEYANLISKRLDSRNIELT